MRILILILIAGKLILIEFTINWLIMKVTNFVIDIRRSRGTTVKYTLTGWQLQLVMFSELFSVLLSYIEIAENASQETAEFQSYLQLASTESPSCIQY